MVRCTRCGKEGHNARNKLCPALKDSQRPGNGAGAGSNDRFAPQTNLNAENRSSLRAPAGNQRYALAGGSGYKKDAFRNNDLGDSRVHDELSYHFNIAYIKDVDVPRHWLKMLHQFFMRMNASMIHCVMERVHDETIADRQLQASISPPRARHHCDDSDSPTALCLRAAYWRSSPPYHWICPRTYLRDISQALWRFSHSPLISLQRLL